MEKNEDHEYCHNITNFDELLEESKDSQVISTTPSHWNYKIFSAKPKYANIFDIKALTKEMSNEQINSRLCELGIFKSKDGYCAINKLDMQCIGNASFSSYGKCVSILQYRRTEIKSHE
jgi:hypothetical protein